MTVEALRSGPVAELIRARRLIVVLRRIAPRDRLLAMVAELADAGVRAFEVTFDTPDADEDLAGARATLAARADGPFVVGAGMLTRRHDLESARRAGADFGSAPLLDPTLVETAVREKLPFMPGAFTPTEVAAAWAAGATFVNLFPASAAGPTFVRDLRGPMPDIQLVATGGLDGSNARAFLDAGAAAVGIGGALTRADAVARRALVALVAGDAP